MVKVGIMVDRVPTYAILADRALLRISGLDAKEFLQGLISNDTRRLAPNQALYAAFLTPQGKYLHDFFLAERDEIVFLDCEAARRADLKRRLTLHRLRSKVAVEEADPALATYAVFGPGALAALGLRHEAGAAVPLGSGIAYADPRLAGAGGRAILAADEAAGIFAARGIAAATGKAYDRWRLELGLPDGSRDIDVDKSVLLECGFEDLRGVDFAKGCYMGQEVTARTKYRGLVKRRLVPVAIDGPAPARGTPLMLGDVEAGEMRSSAGDVGLALIRLERLQEAVSQGRPLTADGVRLTPRKPDWATF